MKHRPEIDGLRAVAIVPVVLFHAGFEAFEGGFVGVDVFFVISGYLITALILEAQAAGRFSLVDFYARRARRILPALFFVLACCCVVAWFVMTPQQIEQFSRTALATALFASNMLFWKQAGYFEPDAEQTPLLHTWSLAVEEQFYIAFPIAMIVLMRWGRAATAAALAAAAVVSLAIAEWGSRVHPTGAFYLAPPRVWELMAGALCAFLLQRRGPFKNDALALAGLLLVVLSVALLDEETRFPSLYALAPVGGSALVILFAAPGALTTRMLSFAPVVWLGLISYSVYLWHQPLFAFARIWNVYDPPPLVMLSLAAAAVVLGWLTWRFVESPFRSIRLSPPSRRALLGAASAGLAVFAALGAAGITSRGFETLWLAAKGERTRTIVRLLNETKLYDPTALIDDGDCRFSRDDLDEPTHARLLDCAARHGPGVVILGDSHAINVYQGLVQNTERSFVFGMVSAQGCRPHAPRPQCRYYQDFASFVREAPQAVDRVIFTQGGYYLLQDRHGNPGRADFFDMGRVPLYRMSEPLAGSVHAYLAELARSVDVDWLGPRLEPRIALATLLRTGCEPGSIRLRPNIREIFERLDDDLKTLVEQGGGPSRLRYISHIDLINFDPAQDFGDCHKLYFADPNHWSLEGELYFGARLAPVLLRSR